MNLPRSDGTIRNGGIVGCTSQGLTWEDELVAEHYTPVSDTVWEHRLGGPDFQADAAIADGVLVDAEVGDGSSPPGDAGVGATMQASRPRRIIEGAAACSVKGAPSESAPALYGLLSLTCLLFVRRRRSALAAYIAERAAIKSTRAIASGVSATFRTDIAPGTEGKPSGCRLRYRRMRGF
jgi:hypothetical protein